MASQSQIPEVTQSSGEFSLVHSTRQEVVETEFVGMTISVVGGVPLLTTLLSPCFRIFGVVVLIRAVDITRESVDFERNVNLAAEFDENQKLLDGILQDSTHGTTPVNIHHHTVRLAVGVDFVLDEDVLTPTVVYHRIGIEDTGLGDFSSLVRIGGLLHLKLLNHLVDCTLD